MSRNREIQVKHPIDTQLPNSRLQSLKQMLKFETESFSLLDSEGNELEYEVEVRPYEHGIPPSQVLTPHGWARYEKEKLSYVLQESKS